MKKNELEWMKKCIEIAKLSSPDLPVASLIVRNDELITHAHNEVELRQNPLFHSEIICITNACNLLNTKYLQECTLYCTLEPCDMCMHAIKLARVSRVVFGAFRNEIDSLPGLDCVGGILESECESILKCFFSEIRGSVY